MIRLYIMKDGNIHATIDNSTDIGKEATRPVYSNSGTVKTIYFKCIGVSNTFAIYKYHRTGK